MYEEIPKLSVGGTAGPFRVAEGLQIVAVCSKEGTGGMPSRDVISQQILLQKLEAASRRYMRDMRRVATIDIKTAMTARLPLAVTMGEPAGVGGELSLKAWLARDATRPFFRDRRSGPARRRSPARSVSMSPCGRSRAAP